MGGYDHGRKKGNGTCGGPSCIRRKEILHVGEAGNSGMYGILT